MSAATSRIADTPSDLTSAVFYASAIYPESEKLVNKSTLFKIEGTFLNPNDGFRSGWGVGGRAEKQGYALIMLEEGDYMDMLEWIVGLSDAFKVSFEKDTRPRALLIQIILSSTVALAPSPMTHEIRRHNISPFQSDLIVTDSFWTASSLTISTLTSLVQEPFALFSTVSVVTK